MDMTDFHLLALTTEERIAARYPGKEVLTPKQVADVIGQHVDHVRDRLLNGSLIPGLRKDGGRWRIPVGSLIEAIDSLSRPDGPAPLPPASQLASTAPLTRRRRPLNAHRERMRAHQFWTEVFAQVDRARQLAQAKAWRMKLADVAGIALDDLPPKPRGPL